ncbi:MAG: FHA domain-containing protein [bacterium]|nr:FHA domain-containing protein [bacterium]
MIKCPFCGAENQEGSAYCEDCGEKLFVQNGAEPAAVSAVPAGGIVAQLTIDGMNFPLSRACNSIGRRSPADGVYPDIDLTDFDLDSYISRRHAQIIREGDDYFFEELGSSNGSYVNGEFMVRGTRCPLKNGDIIKLGKTEVIFVIM